MAKLNFFESLSKPAFKGLTVAVVELLKQDYSIWISASIILVIIRNYFKKNIQIKHLSHDNLLNEFFIFKKQNKQNIFLNQ